MERFAGDVEHARDPITLREALGLFATSKDFAELRAELREGFKKLDLIVPRTEHELREKVWTERFGEQKDKVTRLESDYEARLRSLEKLVMPQWVLTLVAPVLTGIALYFLLPHAH